MRILSINDNTNLKNNKNQSFGFYYKFDLNNSFDRKLKEKLISKKAGAFITQTLAWERVKTVFGEKTDLFMPPKEVSEYKDAYWLQYNELPKICSEWLKSAKPVSNENASEILNTIS